MTPDERWLAANWPFVLTHLPAAPARVVEIGCGRLGGFVPMLESAGYEATGIDPEAPAGPAYRQVGFESYEAPAPVDAIVASASLHHVADLAVVLNQVKALLVPDGRVVIVEWAHERFDEATARWCFARLPDPGEHHARPPEPGERHARMPDPGETHTGLAESGEDHSWLQHRRTAWRESGQPWDEYMRSWAQAERLHSGLDILAALGERFGSEPVTYGPYFFADLAGISEADEQAAIDAGLIQANRIQYAGRPRLRMVSHPDEAARLI
ncbi:MAG TPA: methyltransferase domain-containing protein [Streptosporangiaceae bacterium]